MTGHRWDVLDGHWLADDAWYCTGCGLGLQYIVDAASAPVCRWPRWSQRRVEAFRARVSACREQSPWHAGKWATVAAQGGPVGAPCPHTGPPTGRPVT